MKVKFNGEPKETTQNLLSDFLKEMSLLSKSGIAVAINNSVIPKTEWNTKPIKENDSILIITATQGG